MNQHRIILSSPRYATRTVTARNAPSDARETAARLLIDAPDAAEARARFVAVASPLRTPRAAERLCPACHGDCYVATERGERRCPRCKATGIVSDTSE